MKRETFLRVFVIIAVVVVMMFLCIVIAEAQTHTFPGNNVFPSTSTTDFNAGATVDFTGATVTGLPAGGAVNWGTITGTLSAQTDLQSALNAKATSATTLAGYGITDAYNKTESDTAFQPKDTDLTTWAGLTPSANFQTMVPHTFSQMRTDLSLVPGTNVEVPLTFSTGLTRSTNTVTVNTSQNIATLSNLTTNGFVKTGGAVGTLSVDTATYQGTLTNSAGLRGALSDENGTGAALFSGATTPDFTTGFTIGAAAAAGKIPIGNGTNYVPSTPTWPTAAGTAGYTVRSDGTNFTSYPKLISNGSTASQLTCCSADTYVVGSNVVVTAGDLKVGGIYHCVFDMTKNTNGVAAPTVTVRVGTAGTTSDAAGATFNTFTAGTAVADTGVFEVNVNIRSLGPSVALPGFCRGYHNLATTGLFSNASQFTATSSTGTANTSTATNIGISFNGGTSFSGTILAVQAELIQ